VIVLEDRWHFSVDLEDPYGLDAIYGSISKVIVASKYPRNKVMKLLMNQATLVLYSGVTIKMAFLKSQ